MGRQNKETNIGKEVGKKLRFATMDLEPVCHSLTFTFNFYLTEKTFQYHDKCKVFNFWHVF